ncbi:Copalyl diphosphate synthase-like protein [Emericellopsis cladophorae]|uniref:Copalyl diphosphate synthase-like protein n=1 Tax=Emericellopsis cladophorae TaxID=2686198 RepID=A0A9P9Y8G0_9HYPO|nr:Copalyl diphosphate synthase-like protein [Emericellopsis cladophorae]KAI6785533.1 Copalyl diphosphate synthase-like protein [Emericellopsis cladophorae]
MGEINSLVDGVKSLMQRALQYYGRETGFGTMSAAPYDTARVALVAKEVDGRKQWLFPECFEYLLATQSSAGGWSWTKNAGDASIDSILNTAGPLLALKRHAANPLQLHHDPQILAERISRATETLRSHLANWDVSTTDHVGFEIIVPAMLEFLEQDDASDSSVFDFDGRAPLMKINQAKVSRFRPEYLYGSHCMTALHSFESFIGKIDFDRVSHHKTGGSMLGSPSSTAAYLMHSSTWDDESEAYLRTVVRLSAGQNTGAIPSAFPSTYFETSSLLSTVLRAGYTPAELESAELTQMTEILREAFEHEGGVLGFAPFFEPDVDDSAKTITCLTQLGQPSSSRKLIDVFEAPTHFRTYAGERDPSLTANCNSLIALLQSDPLGSSSQILKITRFLSDYWWKSDGKIKDKWNTSYLYPSVLLVEALVDVLTVVEQGKLPDVLDEETLRRLAITLFQACFRPLLDQKPGGSWNNSVEETAYGVLILGEARKLHMFDDLLEPLHTAIERAAAYMRANQDQPARYIWIEKVSYPSPVVAQSYVLAALRVASDTLSQRKAPSIGSGVWDRSHASGLRKHVELFSQAPLFAAHPRWELAGSMVESSLFTNMVRNHRTAVFDRADVGEDKYFDFIYEMSIIALLNFQVDEFMEATAGPGFVGQFDRLRKLICEMLAEDQPVPIVPYETPKCVEDTKSTNGTEGINSIDDTNGTHEADGTHGTNGTHSTNGTHDTKVKLANGTNGMNGTSSVNGTKCNLPVNAIDLTGRNPAYIRVFSHLSKFLNFILEHRWVKTASEWDQKLLRRELKTYVLGHTQQAEDNLGPRDPVTGRSQPVSTRTTTFFNWVRTTSADHISCPYSFAFICCFMGSTLTPQGGGSDCFPSAGEKYMGNALCRHLSTMCRMYNDLGSTERDRDEGNLNSIDFPEFASHKDVKSMQRALLTLADYERQAYMDTLTRLGKIGSDYCAEGDVKDNEGARLGARRMAIWSMFCEEVDLYGQVYVVRDISAHIGSGVRANLDSMRAAEIASSNPDMSQLQQYQ